MTGPWTFDQAQLASEDAAREQQAAEETLRRHNALYAAAEEAYRKALALKMWRLRRDDNVAWSTLGDLARGDEQVAALKRARDEADGAREIASHAVYRRSADRRDVERFVQWSIARDIAEGNAAPTSFAPAIGRRAA